MIKNQDIQILKDLKNAYEYLYEKKKIIMGKNPDI